MAEGVPEKVLLEKLKAREDELRKREREVKHREQTARERFDELETAKASCDALMLDLHGREALVSEVEKKHGGLKRREDEVSTREIVLADREVALHKRLQQLSQDEQAMVQGKDAHKAAVGAEEKRLAAWEAKLAARGQDLANAEAALSAAKAAFLKRATEEDEGLKYREKVVSDTERRLSAASRTQELRALETEHLSEQAHERLRAIKAEQVDLETKSREARWKDEALAEMLDAAGAKKKTLTAWV
jgi:phage replication-related protein YjqB (UPF0714/DUF867 family)